MFCNERLLQSHMITFQYLLNLLTNEKGFYIAVTLFQSYPVWIHENPSELSNLEDTEL